MKDYLALLKQRPGFRSLWLASVVSWAGDWFNTIASMIIVGRYTDSGLAFSGILIARTLPRFFIGPIAGVVADRFNRKYVMMACDLLRAGIVLSFLFVDRPERVWLIYALTVAQFIVASFFDPASSAIVPGLVKGDQELLSANVLRSITWSVMLTLGAAVGGGFAALFGVELALIIDALSFLLSAYLVLRIVVPEVPEKESIPESGLKDLVEGFRFVVKRPNVAVLTLVKAFGQIGSGDIIYALYAERFFPIGEEGAGALGIMFTAAGIGSVIGPILGNRLTDGSQKALRWAIQWGYLIVPLGWLLIGWAPSIWVVGLGAVLRMMGVSLNWVFSDVLIQLNVQDKFLGRVFSLDLAIFTLFNAAFVWATGFVVDSFALDPRRVAVYFGIGCLLPALLWGIYQYLIKNGNKKQMV